MLYRYLCKRPECLTFGAFALKLCFLFIKINMKLYKAQDYQPQCEDRFRHYQTFIHQVLPLSKIEHIGSSSIPHAISKGDLDIYVEVEQAQFDHAILALKKLGFVEQQDTLRTNELCMLISPHEEVALQVVVQNSVFQFFMSFRDKLRANPLLVEQYNQLKTHCSDLESEVYRRYKSAFIEHVLQSPST